MRRPLTNAELTAYPETRRSKAVTSVGDLMRMAFNRVPRTEVNRPHFGRGLTPERIELCIRNAAAGYMRDMTDLARETLHLDPHLASTVTKRINAVASAPWDLVEASGPGTNPDRAKRYLDVVRAQLDRLGKFNQRRKQLAWGLFDGRAALENHWVYREQPDVFGVRWYLAEQAWLHPRRLSYGPERELRLVDDVYQTYNFAPVGYALRDYQFKFVEFVPQLFGEYPEREGLAPRCLYWSFFKRFSMRDRMMLIELFGKPWRIVTVDEDSNADPEALAVAAETADQMGSNTSARLPRGVKMEVVQVGDNAGEQHADVIAESDRQISKLVLGQVGTTDGMQAGLGNSTQTAVMRDEQLLVFQGDCDLLGEAIEDGVVDPIIALNFGLGEVVNAPRFIIRAEVPPDRKAEGERLMAALNAGLEVSVDEAYEVIGFKKPDEKEARLRMVDSGFGTRAPAIVDPMAEVNRLGDELDKLQKQAPPDPAAATEEDPDEDPMAMVGGEAEEEEDAGAEFVVGDRVKVVAGKEHMPEHAGVTGTVKIVEGTSIGVEFDGIDGVHKWYAPDELEKVADGGDGSKPSINDDGSPLQAAKGLNASRAAAEHERWLLVAMRGDPTAALTAEAAACCGVSLARERLRQPETTYGTLDELVERGVREAGRVADRWAMTLADAVAGKQTAGEVHRALRAAASKLELLPFMRAIERRLVHSTMVGALDSQFEAETEETVEPEAFPAPPGSALVKGPSGVDWDKRNQAPGKRIEGGDTKRPFWHKNGTVTYWDGAAWIEYALDLPKTGPASTYKPPPSWVKLNEAAKAAAAAKAAEVQPKFTRMPYRDAVSFFKKKQPIQRHLFEKLSSAAKARAFTVAGLASDHAIGLVQGELARVIQEGATLADFADRVKQRLESAGFSSLKPSHLETVFRTNLLDAYNVGRRAEMAQPERIKLRPFWRINGVGDARQRESHKRVMGWVLRADDPFWTSAGGPPWGFQCRCRVSSLSPKRAAGIKIRSGAEVRAAGLPDRGFEPNALFPPDLLGDLNA